MAVLGHTQAGWERWRSSVCVPLRLSWICCPAHYFGVVLRVEGGNDVSQTLGWKKMNEIVWSSKKLNQEPIMAT